MNVRSLRFKLSWHHGLIISFVFVCIGLVRYQTVSYRAHRSFDQKLMNDAVLFASQLKPSAAGFQWANAGLSAIDALTFESLLPYFVVTDTQGRVLGAERLSGHIHGMLARKDVQEILQQTSGFGLAVAEDGTVFRFASVRVASSNTPAEAIVHIGRSMAELDAVMEEYFFTYVSSVPLILAVSVIVAWFLSGRALAPFEEVARTAKQITSKNLDMQIVTSRNEVEIQSLVQSFNSMVSRLSRSFQQMRKFNADVAHELRTPLSIMRGENEIALRSASLQEDIPPVLASNLEELERLSRMINDLLTLSELETGNQVIVKKPLNLRALVEDLVEQMRVLALERSIQIESHAMPDALIDGDSLWLRRAFLNLLDNAIKYSREGGLVLVTGRKSDHTFRIGIQDHGIGISSADIPYIFDRLYRADPARSRSSGGTGLGLAVVKWVVEAHGGKVTVSSEPDRGSSFEVAFPTL